MMIQGYGDLWGHNSTTTEEAQAQSLQHFDTDGILLLYAPNGDVVGVGQAQLESQTNVQDGGNAYVVNVPGIVPEHRFPDLYRGLILQGLHWVRANMPDPKPIVMDSWGDLDSTVNVFWELGFSVKQHAIGYRYYLNR